MWFWDYTPSGWGRPKPLTKGQIRKMQQAFKDADKITMAVREQEKREQERVNKKIEDELNFL
jgi:hypothetical protein